MPLGKIELRKPTDPEVLALQEVAKLAWPEHREQFKHLTLKQLQTWIYALNPREALIVMGQSEFREISDYIHSKNKLQVLRDFLWRKIYGHK